MVPIKNKVLNFFHKHSGSSDLAITGAVLRGCGFKSWSCHFFYFFLLFFPYRAKFDHNMNFKMAFWDIKLFWKNLSYQFFHTMLTLNFELWKFQIEFWYVQRPTKYKCHQPHCTATNKLVYCNIKNSWQ